jgi:hypothetical protein
MPTYHAIGKGPKLGNMWKREHVARGWTQVENYNKGCRSRCMHVLGIVTELQGMSSGLVKIRESAK